MDLFSEIRGVNFDNVFGSTEQQQQQQKPPFSSAPQMSATAAPPMMGGILQPQSVGPLASQPTKPQPQRLTKDVDSSLARAAENLSMSTSSSSNLFSSFSPSPSPSASVSSSWPSGYPAHVGATGSDIITGSSSWTTSPANSAGQLQWGVAGVVHGQTQATKNPLDDIVIPERLFAGTVV